MAIFHISVISGSVIILLIGFYFTPIRYLVYYNIISYILSFFLKIKYSLKKSCKNIGLKAYPVIPVDTLTKYGLHKDLVAFYMYIWKKMNFKSNRIISIYNGLHTYFVGKKNFWGKSSFLDPDDDNRYQLWNGVYIIPLDMVFELKDNKLIKIDKFGFDRINKTFDFDYALLLIQYDVYIHFDLIYKYMPEKYKKDIEGYFKLKNLKLYQVDIPDVKYCWHYKGTVEGRSVMLYLDSLAYKAFSTLHKFGRVTKNDQENFKKSLYKGDIIASYIDEYGRIVNPESDNAKYLTIYYSFGIHWENNNIKKETPDYIIKDLTESYINVKYKSFI